MARKGHVGPRTFPANEEQGLVLPKVCTLHYIALPYSSGQAQEQERQRQRQQQRQPQALSRTQSSRRDSKDDQKQE